MGRITWRSARASFKPCADLVARDAENLATVEALDVGKPLGQPKVLDVPATIPGRAALR